MGALVNTCKQCQKRWLGGALTAGLVGRDFGAGFFIFDILYTHLGCFGTQGGVGGSGRVFEHMFQMSVFPIRQAVLVGLFGLRFAARLVRDGSLHLKFYI